MDLLQIEALTQLVERGPSSSSEKISSSVPLDQPSSARKFTNASGM